MGQGESVSWWQGASRIAEQWPYLRYLGMGAWWAWIWLSFSSVSLFEFWPTAPLSQHVGLLYLYSTPAIALMCIVAAVFKVRATRLLLNRPLVIVFGAVAALGSVLVAFSPWAGGDAGFAVGGVLTGVGTSVLCLKTGSVFGTLGRREVMTAGCVAVMFAALLYFMGVGLPSTMQPWLVAILPLASAFLYIMPGDDPFPADEWGHLRGHSGKGTRAFVGLAAASAMVAATSGFGRGVAAAGGTLEQLAFVISVSTFCIFLGAIVIVFLVNCGDAVRMIRVSYAALIFFGIVVVVLSIFGFDLGFLTVGKELLWMMFTCLMAYMVFRFDFSPVRAFGLGQVAYLMASALFWWVGMSMSEAVTGDTMRMAAAAVMVLVIVIVFAFVFSDSDLRFILTWRTGERAETAGQPETAESSAKYPVDGTAESPAAISGEGEPAAPRELTLPERIARIDNRFGISAREAEVMELFAGGRSANWIAEELVISKNTVRSHLRSIYTKLDVHTRQELLDFLKTVS